MSGGTYTLPQESHNNQYSVLIFGRNPSPCMKPWFAILTLLYLYQKYPNCHLLLLQLYQKYPTHSQCNATKPLNESSFDSKLPLLSRWPHVRWTQPCASSGHVTWTWTSLSTWQPASCIAHWWTTSEHGRTGRRRFHNPRGTGGRPRPLAGRDGGCGRKGVVEYSIKCILYNTQRRQQCGISYLQYTIRISMKR